MISWCFIRFISSSVFFCCSICFGLGLFKCFLCRWVLSCLNILFLKSQFYKWDIQPFLSVSQVFVVCIVHSVPALFVLIFLGDFLYNAVYTQHFLHNAFPLAKFSRVCVFLHFEHFLPLCSFIKVFWDYIFKWVSGSQRLLHNMFKRKFHCFMTLAELNVLQTLLAHHHSLGVREQHPHCTSSALVFLQSQTSAVLCCIASHCMT